MNTPNDTIPNPGSDEALALGCRCPVLDNSHGKGAWGYPVDESGKPSFWINENCPLHGRPAKEGDE